MTKYDGTVLINTKIDTEGVESGSKEMESRLSSVSDSLSSLANTAESLPGRLLDSLRIDGIEGTEEAKEDVMSIGQEVQILHDALKQMEKEGMSFGDEFYDESYQEYIQAKAKLDEYKKSLVETEKEQGDVARSSKKMNKELDKTEKSAKRAGKGMNLLGMLGRSILFSFVFKAISAITNSVKEGMNNLAQYSSGTNKTLSTLMSSLTRLKNSFATAFSPILSVVEPVLTKLINLLSTAMTYVGQFFAALTGKGTFTKAVAVQQNYASSLKGTAKAAKKAAGALYAFDELNVLQKQDSGGAGGISPEQMFTDANIDPRIMGIVEKLKSILEPVGNGLRWIYDNVLVPFAEWTISDVIPRFLELFSSAFRILNAVVQAAKPYLQWLWDTFLNPIAEFTGGIILSVLDGLIWAFQEIANWLGRDAESWTWLMSIFQTAGQQLLLPIKLLTEFLNVLLKNKEMTDSLKLAFKGLLTFLSGVFSGNLEKIFNGLKDMVKGIVNGIISIVETGVNFIIDKLNSLSFDVPDWVPIVGGRHFGFSIKKISLPKLAAGTVVPPRAGEFAAILGDNNREAEVVSPLSTMRQAMREELESMGGYGGQVNIIAEGDVDQLIRFFNFRIQQENNRTGVNLTKVVAT